MAAAVAGADNYRDLLKQLPEAEQAQVRAWYARYAADSTTFISNAQRQWMQEHDYPTPDDVLRAASMSDAQLRDLATHGDTKANFFHLARLIGEFSQANDAPAARDDDRAALQTEMTASMDRALASGSAFAGYMFGGYYTALYGANAAGIGQAAGLNWADSRGDSNALLRSRQALMGFPGVSGVRAAEVTFDVFASAARVNPHFLNANRGRGELLIPLR